MRTQGFSELPEALSVCPLRWPLGSETHLCLAQPMVALRLAGSKQVVGARITFPRAEQSPRLTSAPHQCLPSDAPSVCHGS